MATQTVTDVNKEWEVLDDNIRREAHNALHNDTYPQKWGGVEWFLNWVRDHLKNFFTNRIAKLPIVGTWASRIGVTVTEFIMTVTVTYVSFLRVVVNSPTLWRTMNSAAMAAWEANSNSGLLAQTYAYGKKMASYFMEVLLQCFERAIRAQNLNVSAEEKQEISAALDDLLKQAE